MPTEPARRMIGRLTPRCALVALWCLAGAGCAKMTADAARDAAAVEEAASAAEPAATATAHSLARDAGSTDSAPSTPVASPAADTQDSLDDPAAPAEVQLPPPAVSTADLEPAALERPIDAPAPPATRATEHGPIVSSVASPSLPATLDFTSLAARLRKTKAINLRTKVAVKKESDHLLERFRAYHAQRGTATLAELRRSYDALFLKLYALLEDADPPLARDIDRSRAAIWAMLANPMKFERSAPTVSARSVPPA